MDTNEIKREIIRALSGGLRGKWVSIPVAIRNIPREQTVDAMSAIDELISDRLIEFERKGAYPFVRYNPIREQPKLRLV